MLQAMFWAPSPWLSAQLGRASGGLQAKRTAPRLQSFPLAFRLVSSLFSPPPPSTAHSHLMLFTNRFPGVISFAAPTPGIEGQIGAISQSLLSERRLEKVSFYASHR